MKGREIRKPSLPPAPLRLIQPWLFLLPLIIGQEAAHAQNAASAPARLRVSTMLEIHKEDRRIEGRHPLGVSVRARVFIHRSVHVEAAFGHSFTNRDVGIVCQAQEGCSQPRQKSGRHEMASVAVGFSHDLAGWEPFFGIGRGRAWESQYWELNEYDGPAWIWYAGIEKRANTRLRIIAEYRGIRQTWSDGPRLEGKEVLLGRNQIGIGVSFSLL